MAESYLQNYYLLMQSINYHFKNIAILEQALSHRSGSLIHNERLEFLGDAVLNLIISKLLFCQFTAATEGTLSRLRAVLVRKETLVQLAHRFNILHYLKLGGGEYNKPLHSRSSILENTLEAIIGAIYLDSDFITCFEVVKTWYQPLLTTLNPNDQTYKDAKTILQEYLQKQQKSLPQYQLKSRSGLDHALTFIITCTCVLTPVITEGQGHSRREAEQNAATAMLKLLNI